MRLAITVASGLLGLCVSKSVNSSVFHEGHINSSLEDTSGKSEGVREDAKTHFHPRRLEMLPHFHQAVAQSPEQRSHLPGYPGSERHWQGSIDVQARPMQYWFFESRSNPEKDPLILWLSGGGDTSGPIGLSAAETILFDNGPARVTEHGTLAMNPYSWNSNANIIYLDQPQVGGGPSSLQVAKDVAAFITEFVNRNPQFKGAKLHLGGSSYAGGHFVPTTAAELISSDNSPVKLESVIIGSGITNPLLQALCYLPMASGAGNFPPLFDNVTMAAMAESSAAMAKNARQCYIDENAINECIIADRLAHEMVEPVLKAGYNPYNLATVCEHDRSNRCSAELDRVDEFLDRSNIAHGDLAAVNHLAMVGDAMQPYHEFAAMVLDNNVPVLVFNGDLDFVANWIGADAWTSALEWNGAPEYQKTHAMPWVTSDGISGTVQNANGLSFVRVFGAGHMASHDRPQAMLHLVTEWIRGNHALSAPSDAPEVALPPVGWMLTPQGNEKPPQTQGWRSAQQDIRYTNQLQGHSILYNTEEPQQASQILQPLPENSLSFVFTSAQFGGPYEPHEQQEYKQTYIPYSQEVRQQQPAEDTQNKSREGPWFNKRQFSEAEDPSSELSYLRKSSSPEPEPTSADLSASNGQSLNHSHSNLKQGLNRRQELACKSEFWGGYGPLPTEFVPFTTLATLYAHSTAALGAGPAGANGQAPTYPAPYYYPGNVYPYGGQFPGAQVSHRHNPGSNGLAEASANSLAHPVETGSVNSDIVADIANIPGGAVSGAAADDPSPFMTAYTTRQSAYTSYNVQTLVRTLRTTWSSMRPYITVATLTAGGETFTATEEIIPGPTPTSLTLDGYSSPTISLSPPVVTTPLTTSANVDLDSNGNVISFTSSTVVTQYVTQPPVTLTATEQYLTVTDYYPTPTTITAPPVVSVTTEYIPEPVTVTATPVVDSVTAYSTIYEPPVTVTVQEAVPPLTETIISVYTPDAVTTTLQTPVQVPTTIFQTETYVLPPQQIPVTVVNYQTYTETQPAITTTVNNYETYVLPPVQIPTTVLQPTTVFGYLTYTAPPSLIPTTIVDYIPSPVTVPTTVYNYQTVIPPPVTLPTTVYDYETIVQPPVVLPTTIYEVATTTATAFYPIATGLTEVGCSALPPCQPVCTCAVGPPVRPPPFYEPLPPGRSPFALPIMPQPRPEPFFPQPQPQPMPEPFFPQPLAPQPLPLQPAPPPLLPPQPIPPLPIPPPQIQPQAVFPQAFPGGPPPPVAYQPGAQPIPLAGQIGNRLVIVPNSNGKVKGKTKKNGKQKAGKAALKSAQQYPVVGGASPMPAGALAIGPAPVKSPEARSSGKERGPVRNAMAKMVSALQPK